MLPPKYREDLSKEYKQFIDTCLTVDPKHRIDMKDLVHTPLICRLINEEKKNKQENSIFLNQRPEKYHDLFSTQHSTETTLNRPQEGPQDAPISPETLAKFIATYEDGVAILQYCRLIYKSAQLTPSPVLSKWLMNVIYSMLFIKFTEENTEKMKKLVETIRNYFEQYRK